MITREPETAARKTYDLIIIGGGIYGTMLALEASLRDLSALVVEKEDFGGATSFNSLKTIHGGLRTLQTLDIKRYREYAGEQRWFLDHFPDLVKPLRVLMPLYQRGLHRTTTFRIAFWLDRLLSRRLRREGAAESELPKGKVISGQEVQRLFPAVEARRLKGGALWHDAWMPDTQRLIMAILHGACGMGATALNYVEVTELLADRHRVVGVRARDATTHIEYTFSSPVVVNAAGPWSREIARRFDRDLPVLFRDSIAWNVLFDREALSTCSLAVGPPRAGSRVYFMHSWKGRLLAGTGHAPRKERLDSPAPTPEELNGFLKDLNEAIPSLHLKQQDVVHIYSGYLPVRKEGTTHLRRKSCLVEHARYGGAAGLYSISGTRFTAARSTAEMTLSRIFPDRRGALEKGAAFRNERATTEEETRDGIDYHTVPAVLDAPWRERLRQIIEEEAVCHLDDLIFRRTRLGDNPVRALEVAPMVCQLFDWDDRRCKEEMSKLGARLTPHHVKQGSEGQFSPQ